MWDPRFRNQKNAELKLNLLFRFAFVLFIRMPSQKGNTPDVTRWETKLNYFLWEPWWNSDSRQPAIHRGNFGPDISRIRVKLVVAQELLIEVIKDILSLLWLLTGRPMKVILKEPEAVNPRDNLLSPYLHYLRDRYSGNSQRLLSWRRLRLRRPLRRCRLDFSLYGREDPIKQGGTWMLTPSTNLDREF